MLNHLYQNKRRQLNFLRVFILVFLFIIVLNFFLPNNVVYSQNLEGTDFQLFIDESEVPKTYEIHGKYGVSYSVKSNEVLYEKNMHQKAYPASITKILTSIVLLEELDENEKISISRNCLLKEKSNSQIEFKKGEVIDRENALKAIMVLSANDISCAVSEKISGSEEEFGKLMTKRAKELNAINSNFTNAHGLFDENHYTTAYDMALITKEALKYPEIVEVMGQKHATIKTNLQETNVTGKGRYFDRENIVGGKTGFVNESGSTLVEVVKVNDDFIINVIMGSKYPEVDNDMEKMYKDAKKRQTEIKLIHPSDSFEVEVYGKLVSVSAENEFKLVSYQENRIVDSKSKSNKTIDVKFVKNDLNKDFIEEKERIGSFLIFSKDEMIGNVPAITNEAIIKEEKNKQLSDTTIAVYSVAVSSLMYFLFKRRKQRENGEKEKAK